jgi:hypothetical protein
VSSGDGGRRPGRGRRPWGRAGRPPSPQSRRRSTTSAGDVRAADGNCLHGERNRGFTKHNDQFRDRVTGKRTGQSPVSTDRANRQVFGPRRHRDRRARKQMIQASRSSGSTCGPPALQSARRLYCGRCRQRKEARVEGEQGVARGARAVRVREAGQEVVDRPPSCWSCCRYHELCGERDPVRRRPCEQPRQASAVAGCRDCHSLSEQRGWSLVLRWSRLGC